MGPLSSVSNPTIYSNPVMSRVDNNNPQFRTDVTTRERLDLTQTAGSQIARSQNTDTKDYIEKKQLPAPNSRRGSLLDMTA